MSSHLEKKLTDEQLSDLLGSNAVPGANGAMDDPELLALKAALRSYRMETLTWAERRSAAQPSLAAKARESRWAAVPQWSLATVAVVAVAAGVVHFAGYGADDGSPTAAPITATVLAPANTDDIAADNQLLGSIDRALRYEEVSPVVKPTKATKQNAHAEVTD